MPEEPNAAVKACITSNAASVDLAFESLSEGVDFLTTKICAGEIADQASVWSVERAKKQQADQQARMKAMCASQASRPKDEFGGQDYLGMMCSEDSLAIEEMWGPVDAAQPWLFGPVNAPKATSLAAKSLLDARVKRVKPR
jgi:hypothetical protein